MASPGGREAGRVNIRVVPDTSRLPSTLRRELEIIEARLSLTIPVRADLTRFNSQTRAQIAALQRQRVTIRVDADGDALGGLRTTLNGLGDDGAAAGGPLNALTRIVGGLRFAALTAIPNVASLAASVAQTGPATAVAVPGLLAVASAVAAVKIGTAGVADALSGDAEAMERLAPAARSFVTELRGMRGAYDELRRDVQQELFSELGDVLRNTATATLPVFRSSLINSARTLGNMAAGAANAAAALAENGTLGRALDSADRGLSNLAGLPAVIVRGLIQIGAAAGPSFERLTAGAAGAAERAGERLSRAFETGRLQQSIERAVSLVGQLLAPVGNLGRALGNVFGPAADAGAGFLGVLNDVSRTLADVTGTRQAQEAFSALFSTLAAAGRVISGVLGAALESAIPLLSTLVSALSGPLQDALDGELGPALQRIVRALGSALGPAVESVSRLLAQTVPIVAEIAGMAADELAPALVQVGPLLGQTGDVLSAVLLPVLRQLPAVLGPLLSQMSSWVGILVQLGQQLLTAVGPSLAQLSASFGELLAATEPLREAFNSLGFGILASVLVPVLTVIISLVGQVASVFANVLSGTINGVVIPVLNIVTSLLRGDFSGAWQQTRELVGNVGAFFRDLFVDLGRWAADGVAAVVSWLLGLPGRAAEAAADLGPRLRSVAREAMADALAAIRSGGGEVLDWLRGLPDRAKDELGDLSRVLYDAGRDLIQGLIDGISSMLGGIRDAIGSVTDLIPDFGLFSAPAPEAESLVAPLAKRLTNGRQEQLLRPAGNQLMSGFEDGLTAIIPSVRAQLRSVTEEISAYRPTLSVEIDNALGALTTNRPSAAGPLVSIDTFVATERQTPASIARELAWQAKARG